MKNLKIVSVKSEVGAGTRGARMGFDALQTVDFEEGSKFFQYHEVIDCETFNESIFDFDSNTIAKNSKAVYQTCEAVAKTIQETLKLELFPFIIAGDHSSAAGTISGIKAAYPERRLGVFWVDAHADLQTPFTSETGNMHGMPLAMVSGVDNQESAINVPSESITTNWSLLKSLSGSEQAVDIKDIVFFGARDIDKAEEHLMKKFGIKNFSVEEVRTKGHLSCVNEAFELLSDCDLIYLSFDVDSMDPMVSRGTGTPVENGFTSKEANDILLQILGNEKIVAAEVVEINPTLDTENKMAKTVLPMIIQMVETIQSN